MSIRLDPRRATALKHLAGEAGVRPGDLVRQWVEERIDSSRPGAEAPAAGQNVVARLEQLTARVAALESMTGTAQAPASEPAPSGAVEETTTEAPKAAPRVRKSASAAPSGPRVALHDEMIAVIGERGALSAADLAEAIAERGRYLPPRSGKPLDAAMVSQRVSNPTYRSRFKRSEGRIGLAEDAS
jgi:electron transfer flavoprotein alpha subunit